MILVPELKTIVLLVPRTGSSSIRQAVMDKYPNAIQLYRHMEADGVPFGYDKWTKVGVVRNPLDRLWSLYKFMRDYSGAQHSQERIMAMRGSALSRSFSDWIVHNQTPFTGADEEAPTSANTGWPQYSVLHTAPENKKSQAVYLRPDLGTVIYRYCELNTFAKRLGVTLPFKNATPKEHRPAISRAAAEHMDKWFAWDYEISGRTIA